MITSTLKCVHLYNRNAINTKWFVVVTLTRGCLCYCLPYVILTVHTRSVWSGIHSCDVVWWELAFTLVMDWVINMARRYDTVLKQENIKAKASLSIIGVLRNRHSITYW